jgi:hypothetical protein
MLVKPPILHTYHFDWALLPVFSIAHPSAALVSAASDVLLYATPCSENWPLIEVSTGNTLLYLLRFTERCSASIRGTRVVYKRMAVSWRAEAMVQTSNFGRWNNHILGYTAVSVL